MKLVTNDYGCGTSSSILDYEIEDVVVVSENDYKHVFDIEDDLFFIGHDFLFYLWDSEEKLKKWLDRSQKFEHWLWCFERVDAIVPAWKTKSHISLSITSKFCKRILACDEDDCDKYNFDWLPQWASNKFFIKRNVKPTSDKILFSGQAGGPEYNVRNLLIQKILADDETKELLSITNTKRSLTWNQYIDNVLKHSMILNPFGILKGLNTRAYECLYSNRLVFQQKIGNYKRHEALLQENLGIVFFENFDDLKKKIRATKDISNFSEESYKTNSLYSRLKSIGLTIK